MEFLTEANLVVFFIIQIFIYSMIFITLCIFLKSIWNNKNPYKFYNDDNYKSYYLSNTNEKTIKRNYFFGPGFYQITKIFTDAFEKLFIYRIVKILQSLIKRKKIFLIIILIILSILILIIDFIPLLLIFTLSIVLYSLLLIISAFFFLLFSLVWIPNRAYQLIKGISYRCPKCFNEFRIPAFKCVCGSKLLKVEPGPYGIIMRKCICGKKIPTTFIGRAVDKAINKNDETTEKFSNTCNSVCEVYVSPNSKQFGIQFVGRQDSGKTTFLAAFWHEYKALFEVTEELNNNKPNDNKAAVDKWKKEFAPIPTDDNSKVFFKVCEKKFDDGEKIGATSKTDKYSISHKWGKHTSAEIAFYDIAGETYEKNTELKKQKQFEYCEEFLISIDLSQDSNAVSDAISNFIEKTKNIKEIPDNKTIDAPTAVVLMKADLYEYKKEIGYPIMNKEFKNNAEGRTFEEVRDDMCISFLKEHGYKNLVKIIDLNFSKVRYFPASPIGHAIEEMNTNGTESDK